MNSSGERVLTTIIGDFSAGVPAFVHVKGGQIIRIRLMIFQDN